jgi:hypothetical protein
MRTTRRWRTLLGAGLLALLAGAGFAESAKSAEPAKPVESAERAASQEDPVPVQPEEDLTADVELTRAAIQVRRQALVTAAMDLEPAEADVFWPLYHEYREEMAKPNDRFTALLTAYLDSGGNLSNEEAATALDDYLGIEGLRTGVKQRFVPRFREALPATKVMRFFQVDNKLDALINAELAAAVPLVR